MNLKLADVPLRDVIAHFAAAGVEAGYLVPTATGLGHSILDAHSLLRDYLRRKGIHDYALQAKGQEAKKEVPAFIVLKDRLVESRATLYRPESKDGDPRIWFKHLRHHCKAGNVLAVLAHEGRLYLVNASDVTLRSTIEDSTSTLGGLAAKLCEAAGGVAAELLTKLRQIGSRGYVPTMRKGDTGIGFTLESLLGIKANSSNAPDYKGIEIKTGRVTTRGRTKCRGTIFSCAPSWTRSALPSAMDLLDEHGYDRGGQRRLCCTIEREPNAQGLFLELEPSHGLLHVRHQSAAGRVRDAVCWHMHDLEAHLAEKHRETFWVKARTKRTTTTEAFHFFEAVHTRGAMSANLGPLMDEGVVTLDFTLKVEPNKHGGHRARDHGYLFKIWSKDRSLLFPASTLYALA